MPASSRRPPAARLLRAGAVALVLLAAAAPSLAQLAADAATTGNLVRAGALSVLLHPVSPFGTIAGIVPGDTVSGALRVENAGTTAVRYAFSTTTTTLAGQELGTQIQLVVKSEGSSCAAWDGTTLASGAFGLAAFGDPAPGAQAGDRTLAAGASETLCLRATLPDTTSRRFQHSSAATDLLVAAEQIPGGP